MTSQKRKPVNQLIDQRTQHIYIVVLLGFLVVAGRCSYLQIYRQQDFKVMASEQQQKMVSIAGKRGMITDREGNKLAMDLQAHAVYVEPKHLKLEENKEKFEKLADLLKITPEALQTELKKKYWHYLARKQDDEVAAAIRKLKLPGIGLLRESKRVYPHNAMAASLIGYTDIDNKGREGIESSFDQYLEGGTRKVGIITDAYGSELLRVDGNLPFLTEKSKSNKVMLTIDENIQYIAERELKVGMENTKSDRGVVIIMDVKNGDLLALATNPSVDLNEITAKGWDSRIKNWGVTDVYEPGSTMKVFTIAAALEAGVTDIGEVIPTPTMIMLDGWPLHDHHQPPGHTRYLKPFEILQVSSNVGSSILGRRVSPERYRGLLKRFGFGVKTSSGLYGEVPGILPPLPWRQGRHSTITYGQGIAVTPLQIVTAASALANKGVRVEPRIIQRIVSPDGDILKEFPTKKYRTLSEVNAEKVMDMMRTVVEEDRGTASVAKIPGYVLGGKTGTADKVVNGRYNGDVMASFLGVLPADNPEYVIFVLFDAPKTAHYASMTAVPVFRKISQDIITYKGIQPSRPEELNALKVR